ncbi:carboxypeptidase regulatory-like domain-containing protein [bacterium]
MLKTLVKIETVIILCMIVVVSGCGGGGAGGGWSSGDVTPGDDNTGNVAGYVYQAVVAANRQAAARTILVSLENATVTIAGKTATSNSNGYYSITGVPVGTYSLVIRATGYETETVEDVTVSKDATTTATQQGDSTYAMTPLSTADLTVSSTPTSAAIFLDGTDTSSSTSNTFTLYAGDHTVKLTMTGYEDYESTEDVSNDISVTYTLTKVVTAISASPSGITLTAGESTTPTLTCTFIDDSTGACPDLTWNSSNSDIAIVGESTGQIAGVAAGSASITGTRSGSEVSIAITVTVISAGDTLSTVIIDAEGVSSNALNLSSGGSATFSGTCIYTSAGTAACPASCVYSSSDAAAGAIGAADGAFACEAAGGLTEVKLTCGATDSNTVEVSCAISDTNLALKVFGAADADGDGTADAAYADTVSLNPGNDIIVRIKVENGTSITGFRTDLEISSTYLSPETIADTANCSAYSSVAYDTSSVCVYDFDSGISESNPFFGSSTLDSVSAVTYVSGGTVESQTCLDTSKKANRLDCAISTRQVSDVQPAVSGSEDFVYFILQSSASASSGAQTTVSISSDTLQVMGEDAVEIEIGESQVSGLTINFQ